MGRAFYSTSAAGDVTVSPTDVPTTTGPGRTLLTFNGTNGGTDRVVLPPATNATAYKIIVENLSGAPLTFATTPSSSPGPEATIAISQRLDQEDTFRQAVQTIVAAGIALDYRTEIEVNADGVFRVPGYTESVA